MNPEAIGRRSQDVQTGLRDVRDLIVPSTIPITSEIGMAALLAVHIRGLDVIGNIPAFIRFGESLGIPYSVLPHVVRILESAAWVTATPNAYNLKQLTERVPVFQSLYDGLGQQWQARQPSELEHATLQLVEDLSVSPEPEDSVVKRLGLAPDAVAKLVALGDLGGYVRAYDSPREGKRLLYSPLYADDHPERLLNFLAANEERYVEVQRALAQTRNSPGIPVADLLSVHPVVREMIDANVLVAPAIESSAGLHTFLFSHVRTGTEQTVVNKARVLLACVRYGERFSTITRVDDPSYLLDRLRDSKVIGRTPHSNIKGAHDVAVGA